MVPLMHFTHWAGGAAEADEFTIPVFTFNAEYKSAYEENTKR